MSTPSDPVPQRIGDAERDRAVELLREHMAQGRLDQVEFDERLTTALSARTAADLDPLFSDLPGPRPGQGVVPSPAFQAPPWQNQNAVAPVEPSSQAVAPTQKKWNTALVVASSVAWPATLLFLFATSWSYWWLIFIPIMISSIAGKNHQDSNQHNRHHGPLTRSA